MVGRNDPVVSRDPDVMHGELVFTGTRVPAKTSSPCITSGSRETTGSFLETKRAPFARQDYISGLRWPASACLM